MGGRAGGHGLDYRDKWQAAVKTVMNLLLP